MFLSGVKLNYKIILRLQKFLVKSAIGFVGSVLASLKLNGNSIKQLWISS